MHWPAWTKEPLRRIATMMERIDHFDACRIVDSRKSLNVCPSSLKSGKVSCWTVPEVHNQQSSMIRVRALRSSYLQWLHIPQSFHFLLVKELTQSGNVTQPDPPRWQSKFSNCDVRLPCHFINYKLIMKQLSKKKQLAIETIKVKRELAKQKKEEFFERLVCEQCSDRIRFHRDDWTVCEECVTLIHVECIRFDNREAAIGHQCFYRFGHWLCRGHQMTPLCTEKYHRRA